MSSAPPCRARGNPVEELGDLFFAAVCVSRFLNADPMTCSRPPAINLPPASAGWKHWLASRTGP